MQLKFCLWELRRLKAYPPFSASVSNAVMPGNMAGKKFADAAAP